ncbi:MAG: hypothetical protein KGI33_04470 [Thaumarchaeota archaeon]|nr:hypothetical protein [Nitrososphaerota archaeon]
MGILKSFSKVFVLIVSGIAIVVVGGFMMGAVARLWLPRDSKKAKDDDGKQEAG